MRVLSGITVDIVQKSEECMNGLRIINTGDVDKLDHCHQFQLFMSKHLPPP